MSMLQIVLYIQRSNEPVYKKEIDQAIITAENKAKGSKNGR